MGYGSAIFQAVDTMVQKTANILGVPQRRIERIDDAVDPGSRTKVVHLLRGSGYIERPLDDGEIVWMKTFRPENKAVVQ